MKQLHTKSILLVLLFMVMSFFFSRQLYPLFFTCIFGLLLAIVTFREAKRVFAWIMISFFSGHLTLFYVDRFIENDVFSPVIELLLHQLLLLIPILMIAYVIKQFRKPIIFFSSLSIETDNVDFLFGSIQAKKFNILISTILVLLVVGGLFAFELDFNFKSLLIIVLFFSLQALLEEILWRGILLTHLIRITNKPAGILVMGIVFGVHKTMFGFSILMTAINILIGLLLGFVAVKSRSIVPSIVIHWLILFLLYILGLITLPII